MIVLAFVQLGTSSHIMLYFSIFHIIIFCSLTWCMIFSSFCPMGSIDPIPCPAGTYGSSPGLQTIGCSGKCSAGMKCEIFSTFACFILISNYQTPYYFYSETGSCCPVSSISDTAMTCPAGYNTDVCFLIQLILCIG